MTMFECSDNFKGSKTKEYFS